MQRNPSKRGGDMKRHAPPGMYTARQAQERLHLTKSTFYYYVDTDVIHPVRMPPRREAYYDQKEIDALAQSMVLAQLARMTEELTPTEFRAAGPEDAEGIYDVVKSLGWQATPASLRRTWYEVNSEIDHIVVQDGVVMGYINAVPYKPEALEAMMSGRKKGWDMRASDILPFESGHTYDLFVGLVERPKPEKPGRYARYGLRLVLGFRRVLEQWAARGIIIRRLYVHSAEPEGQQLAALLGFDPLPEVPGDLYPRYVLDLQISDHLFARQYRALLTNAAS